MRLSFRRALSPEESAIGWRRVELPKMGIMVLARNQLSDDPPPVRNLICALTLARRAAKLVAVRR